MSEVYGCRGIGGPSSGKLIILMSRVQTAGILPGALRKPTNPHIPAMMMLADADAQAWAIGPPLQGKVIQTANVTYNGKPATVQLMPRSQMGSVTTPWAPNVYRGTGEEERQTITFEITPELYEQFQRLENAILEKARGIVPNVDAFWHSALRPAGNHPATLKAKIHTSGKRLCRYVDEDGQPVEPPTEWRGRPALPILAIQGLYIQKTMVGLMIDVVALMVGPEKERPTLDYQFT